MNGNNVRWKWQRIVSVFVVRHRFRCSWEESLCLSLITLTDEHFECLNRFSQLCFGVGRSISSLRDVTIKVKSNLLFFQNPSNNPRHRWQLSLADGRCLQGDPLQSTHFVWVSPSGHSRGLTMTIEQKIFFFLSRSSLWSTTNPVWQCLLWGSAGNNCKSQFPQRQTYEETFQRQLTEGQNSQHDLNISADLVDAHTRKCHLPVFSFDWIGLERNVWWTLNNVKRKIFVISWKWNDVFECWFVFSINIKSLSMVKEKSEWLRWENWERSKMQFKASWSDWHWHWHWHWESVSPLDQYSCADGEGLDDRLIRGVSMINDQWKRSMCKCLRQCDEGDSIRF